jgi:Protein of unknown function (DUF3040)
MNDDQVSRRIEELERALAQDAIEKVEHDLACDDPAFTKRFRALHRAEIATVLTVFVLLAAGAVLLTVGFATRSWPTWIAGVLAFLASFAVDEHHKHALRRTP